MAGNDRDLLCRVLDRLAAAGAPCLVFGGWAEELLGLSPPRPHRDIDLLLAAPSFAAVDALLAGGGRDLAEIRLKRFAHKRAFQTAGVLVEITLVQPGAGGPTTLFWGDVPFVWLAPLGCVARQPAPGRDVAATTPENLARYRTLHRSTQPWRWRDAAALVAGEGAGRLRR